jgi:hypothetical protein
MLSHAWGQKTFLSGLQDYTPKSVDTIRGHSKLRTSVKETVTRFGHALSIRQLASRAFKKTLPRPVPKRLDSMRPFFYDEAIKKT